MRKIELNLSNIHTVGALHIYLQYKLELPDYYGRNLDALYDVLTDESEATCICVQADKNPSAEMAAYMPRLLRVMSDAAAANPALEIAAE